MQAHTKSFVFQSDSIKNHLMLQLNFTENFNGKLFTDHFSDIRPHNPGVYFLGNCFRAIVKDTDYGIIKIVAVPVLSLQ